MGTETLRTPIDLFLQWEKQKPNSLALKQPYKGVYKEWTWGEAADEVRRLAAALKAKNLPPHSKIGLVSKNCSYWIMCDLAIMMAGHVSVPIYPNVNEFTINYVLQHSEAELLFVGKLDDWPRMACRMWESLE